MNQKYFAVFFIGIIYWLGIISCNSIKEKTNVKGNDSIYVEYFVNPRNSNSECSPMNLASFPILRKNQLTSYDNAPYRCNTIKDSIVLYYYTKLLKGNSSYYSLVSSLKATKEQLILSPKIIIIFHFLNDLPNDTIGVDRIPEIIYKRKKYVMPNSFFQDLLNIMPIELLENWKFDLSSSPKAIPY